MLIKSLNSGKQHFIRNMYDKMLFIRMLIKSLNSGNHYQFITLFVVCATGRSCLLLTNNVVPFDNKDSAKKKHRQIYRFIKVQ